jgi:glycosyltransferase involved in cell wall biosynthesis
MNPSPLFSVIIPTYNRSSLLLGAISSVQAQSYDDWELIIIDDGSTDDTRFLVEPYLSDARIRYHWQENRELNGARNTGIRLAAGTYLTFLDDDDYYEKDHLSSLATYLQQSQYPVAAIRTGMYILENNQQRTAAPLLDVSNRHPVKALWETPVNLLSFAFHRAIFQQHTFEEDFILAEDFHFLIRVFLNYPFIQLPNYTVVYRLQQISRSNQYYQPAQLANKIKALRATWEQNEAQLRAFVPEGDLEYKITKEYLHFSKAAFRANDHALGWRYYKAALIRNDWRFFRSYLSTLVLGILGK